MSGTDPMPGRFTITWDGSWLGYTVSEPNLGDAGVPIDVIRVDALLSDAALRAAVYSQCADRGIDVTAPGVSQAVIPDEYRWARNALRAAINSVTGKDTP